MSCAEQDHQFALGRTGEIGWQHRRNRLDAEPIDKSGLVCRFVSGRCKRRTIVARRWWKRFRTSRLNAFLPAVSVAFLWSSNFDRFSDFRNQRKRLRAVVVAFDAVFVQDRLDLLVEAESAWLAVEGFELLRPNRQRFWSVHEVGRRCFSLRGSQHRKTFRRAGASTSYASIAQPARRRQPPENRPACVRVLQTAPNRRHTRAFPPARFSYPTCRCESRPAC